MCLQEKTNIFSSFLLGLKGNIVREWLLCVKRKKSPLINFKNFLENPFLRSCTVGTQPKGKWSNKKKTNKIKNEYITVKEFIIMMKYNFLSEKIKLPDNIKCLRDIFY